MSRDDEKNILYGGPEPELIDKSSKSLGEAILRKLTENGDDIMFVSQLLPYCKLKTKKQ